MTLATGNSAGLRSANSSTSAPPQRHAATGTSHDQLDRDHRHNADDRAPRWWSSSAPGECLGEHRKIAVMSEAQSCELVLLEPPDGIVFVQREIDRSSPPALDQPDLHVERIGMDLQEG